MAIPDDRGDESFADDLNMWPGIVSGRVALLLRSTEIQPAAAPICPLLHSIVGFGVPLVLWKKMQVPPPGALLLTRPRIDWGFGYAWVRGTPPPTHAHLVMGFCPPLAFSDGVRVVGFGMSRCVPP